MHKKEKGEDKKKKASTSLHNANPKRKKKERDPASLHVMQIRKGWGDREGQNQLKPAH